MSYPPPPRPIEYLFVDGGYLRKRMEDISRVHFGGDRFPSPLPVLLSTYQKAFYYDCLPARRPKESEADWNARREERQSEFNELRSCPGLHVFQGQMVGEEGRARQKGVDIQIAVHMMNHAHRRNAAKFTLLAGDQDFRPLVESLVQDGIYVTVWFSHLSCSRELVWAADAQRPLTFWNLVALAPGDFKARHPYPDESSAHGDAALPTGDLFAIGRAAKAPDLRVIRTATGQLAGVIASGSSGGIPTYTCATHTDLDKLGHFFLAQQGVRYVFDPAAAA